MTTIVHSPPSVPDQPYLLEKWFKEVRLILARLLATRISFSATYDPPNIANNASSTATFTVTGAAAGDIALASHSVVASLPGFTLYAFGSAANEVKVVFTNNSGGAVDIASGTIYIDVYKRNL